MSNEQNWRIPTDATDYLLHRQKQGDLEQRRPNIRQASDLVGPGIGAYAVRLTDFDDVLATFNGFFSSLPGALNAPNSTGTFVGMTAVDSEMGGVQVFTEMESGDEYRRTFQRYPGDESVILWGTWQGEEETGGIVPTAVDTPNYRVTSVPAGTTFTPLRVPEIDGIGLTDTFESTYAASGVALNILRPGVYSGHVSINMTGTGLTAALNVNMPDKASMRTRAYLSVPAAGGIRLSFLFINTSTAVRTLSLSLFHSHASAAQNVSWRELQITRLGDAT